MTISISKGKKSVDIFHVPGPKEINVVVSIPVAGVSYSVWRQISMGYPSERSLNGYAITASCYATASLVIDKLNGGSVQVNGFKVTKATARCLNNHLNISLSCANVNGSAVLKVIVKTLSFIQPEKGFALFSGAMKLLKQKPNRDEFNWCVGQILDGCKSVKVVAIGSPFKLSDDAKKVFTEKISASLDSCGSGQAVKGKQPEKTPDEYGELILKCDSWCAPILEDFLKSSGVFAHIYDGGVAVHSGTPNSKGLETYIQRRFARGFSGESLALFLSSDSKCSSHDLHTVIKKKSVDELVACIKKALP
jgi:hypothetical protein